MTANVHDVTNGERHFDALNLNDQTTRVVDAPSVAHERIITAFDSDSLSERGERLFVLASNLFSPRRRLQAGSSMFELVQQYVE
jgi:hypothetical protein